MDLILWKFGMNFARAVESDNIRRADYNLQRIEKRSNELITE